MKLKILFMSFLILTTSLSFAGEDTSASSQVAKLVNHERRIRGLRPLTGIYNLSRVASKHAQDMYHKGYFSHRSLDGRTLGNRLREENIRYSAAGENIAMGQKTAQKVMIAWMKSPGHKRNILNSKYKKIGIARAGFIWVQNFSD